MSSSNTLTQTLPLPDWADLHKIERGQQLFEKWGIVIAVCLFCASLPSSYAAAKGVQVLHLTARLDTDARRRVMETGQFLFDTLSVGGLGGNGNGRRTIQRVRLMHAAVRHLILARNEQSPGQWRQEWGLPLNQEDMAGTLMSFSYVVADPMRRLSVHVPAKDIDAYLHVWNVIGHLLGVRDELLAHDAAEANALVETIRLRQFRESPEGKELTTALLTVLDEVTPFHRFDDSTPPLIRHLIGDDTADLLDIPESDLSDDVGRFTRVVDWLLIHILGWTERDSRRYHLMSHLARSFGIDLLRTGFTLQRGGDRPPFAIPDHLDRRWDLTA